MAWTKLTEIVSTATADDYPSETITALDWLFVVGEMTGTGDTRINFQLGSGGSVDTNTNYFQRYSPDYSGTWSTNNSTDGIRGDLPNSGSQTTYFNYLIQNIDGFRKNIQCDQVLRNGQNDTNAPLSMRLWATWNETDQANIINFENRETGSFTSIKATVWGTDYTP
jgi:hypothetical protein